MLSSGEPMSSQDSKQAEKDYLRRSAGGEWEVLKPFPPPGQLATEAHAQYLLDFAVMLRVLSLRASDLVLDLGAGSCWVSDWLRRCGVRTIALDIAWDMLKLGAARLNGAHGLVTGDMEALPFPDGTFSKACCLNAFHHIPDTPKALREIKRVLTADGVVLFSEPGAGHASHPTSLAATRNYGVLEKEILIDEFMDACLAAGFVDVRLHPIAHIIPLFELQQQQWRDWSKFTASQRPFRALEKIWRGVLETLGLAKKNLLFEEAFAIRLLREMQPVIEQHPVITAHRTPFVKPALSSDGARIELVNPPQTSDPSQRIALRIRLTNVGNTRWDPAPTAAGQVRLGVQLISSDGAVITRDFSRHNLPAPIEPGGRCELLLQIPPPPELPEFQLKVDLVREGVSWFELGGSETVTHRVRQVR